MSKQQPSQEIKPCHVQYSGQTQERELHAVACKSGLAQGIRRTHFCLFKTKLPHINAEETSSETLAAEVNQGVGSEVAACNSQLQYHFFKTVKTDYY